MFRYLLSFFLFSGGGYIDQNGIFDYNVKKKKKKKKKKILLSYDVASGSEITPCNKIDKPLVVYRFTGNVMTSITTLRT